MRYGNAYFITGLAYAGKSTMVKRLAEKHGGIACGENYHDALLPGLDAGEFPNVTYTRDLRDWRDFIRRTPEEYEAWVKGASRECEILELRILDGLAARNPDAKIFVDTNISLATLGEISDRGHVLVMLADQATSVNRFFERPDREKQFLYRLLTEEPEPEKALANFRECLLRINSRENYEAYLRSGFPVILRDENRTVEETLALAEEIFGLRQTGAEEGGA